MITEEEKGIEKLKEEKYIQKLKEHIKCCEDAMKYSLDRFDILIITLSSGALGFSMSFIKDVAKNNNYHHLTLLKFSWLLFGISLIANLLSQVTSFFAHQYELKISKNLIRKEKGKNSILNNETKIELTKKIFDYSTYILNAVSLLALIGGVIILIIFTYNNF